MTTKRTWPGGRTPLPAILEDTVQAALGQAHRDDPVTPSTGGPAGNARLTAWTGLVLLVLSLAELVTLISVSGLISWHIVIGTLLVPPALLKTASTGWRILRYYRGNPGYRQAGPPPMLLRLLGPGVVASTLGLLGSGLVLILLGQRDSRTVLISALGQQVDWLTLHQGLFIVWAALTGVHVLARTVPALQLTVLRTGAARPAGGAKTRAALVVGSLMVAVVTAVFVLSASGSWRHGDFRDGSDRPDGARAATDR